MLRAIFVGVWCLAFGISPVSSFCGISKNSRSNISHNRPQRRQHILRAAPRDDRTLGRKQGVYTRPSGAIERGSGFYFPGLEGPKVRLAFGSVLLSAVAINHVISDHTTLLEVISTLYASLVLLQGIVQFRRENAGIEPSSSTTVERSSKTVVSYEQTWHINVENIYWKQTVEWAAATFTALTPATHFVLLGSSQVFSFGTTSIPMNGASVLSTIRNSKTGRVSLPPTHPVSQKINERYRTTVILQRVTENLVLVIASDQLLAAFAATDLEWLGRLAKLLVVDDEMERDG